ncbi:MAG: DUF423 domain-containing protein [bacterium]
MNAIRAIAALLGFLAVALGAFGAHALADHITPDRLEAWKTAVQYQMFHVLALLLTTSGQQSGRSFVAAWCFLTGVLIFSGSLYLLVLTGSAWLGAITPIGGTLFLIGWLILLIDLVRGKQEERSH